MPEMPDTKQEEKKPETLQTEKMEDKLLLDIDEFTIDTFINVLFVEITAKQQNNAVADKLHRKYNRYL